uniref:Uncharacterized protein n=1 Tax=Anopheles albimanus TaxID=7167 RepID=A0A182FYJ2_ANOAL
MINVLFFQKLTVNFTARRNRNAKALAEYKSIMTKERSAIVNASMEEVNTKQWSARYISITPSMEIMKQQEDNLQENIENLKQNCFTACEEDVHSEYVNNGLQK